MAKSINPALAQAQAEYYVREIEKRQGWKPFVFLTNGTSIYFLDVDRASKRLVYGFFSKKDLENLLFARKHGTSLSATAINPSIVSTAITSLKRCVAPARRSSKANAAPWW